jgi:hypothetical protein
MNATSTSSYNINNNNAVAWDHSGGSNNNDNHDVVLLLASSSDALDALTSQMSNWSLTTFRKYQKCHTTTAVKQQQHHHHHQQKSNTLVGDTTRMGHPTLGTAPTTVRTLQHGSKNKTKNSNSSSNK